MSPPPLALEPSIRGLCKYLGSALSFRDGKRFPMTHPSRFFTRLLLAALITHAASAQEPATTAPSFRSQTNLVLIPVQVRSHGQHVPNLKQEAFTLLQDGKQQK